MKKKVAIIGGGTAGLFLAAFLNKEKFEVTIFEKKVSLGRKFLVAGDGGFNLTHSEGPVPFKARYTPSGFLDNALDNFTNTALRIWLLGLGIPTFIGSSGRVFPEKGIKPIEVLNFITGLLIEKNVTIKFRKRFTGWNKQGALVFNEQEIVKADYHVFAMGGASWKVTGSDGSWLSIFNEKGIDILPFRPANCAYKINWQKAFIEKQEGKPLKNISISINHKTQKGEAVITKFGIEGNAIYGLSPEIQPILNAKKKVAVTIDFKPTLTTETILKKLTNAKSNLTTTLKEKIKLSPPMLDLIKSTLTKEEFLDLPTLAKFIKNFPITLVDAAPIDEAISTSGGIDLKEVDDNFQLKKIENTFCLGEMLDWNAPTGGYLIQACASMGVYLARHLNND